MPKQDNPVDPFIFSHPGVFTEHHGFFLGNASSLHGLCEREAGHTDLLDRFTTTDEGDQVAKDGIAMPIFVEEAGYYTFVFRHVSTDEPLSLPVADSSDGWILKVEGGLCFASLAALKEWSPAEKSGGTKRVTVQIPDGWYHINLRLYENSDKRGDDGVIEVIMDVIDEQPAFHGDLFHVLSFAA